MSKPLADHAHALPESEVVEVSDGVFAYIQPDGSWMINNTGFLVGRDGVIAIDSLRHRAPHPRLPRRHRRRHAPRRSARWSTPTTTATTRRQRPVPRRHDRRPRARPRRDAGARAAHNSGRLDRRRLRRPRARAAVPHLRRRDRRCGSTTCAASCGTWAAPAHTTNDVVVWLPERSVLFAGDLLFNGGTPFLLMGSVAGAIDVLEGSCARSAPRRSCPGHGPVGGPELIDDGARLPALRPRRRPRGHAAGLTPAGARPRHRPRRVRRVDRPRAHRRQPAPRLRRADGAAAERGSRSTSPARSATWSPTTAAGP